MRSSLTDFFTPEPALYHAGAKGFALFGAGHLVSLALSLAIVTLCVGSYLRLPAGEARPSEQRRAALVRMSGAAVAIVLAKCAVYLAFGLFEPLFWPLHVCNLCEFAALGFALSPSSHLGKLLGHLLFFWGLTGCVGALLLPGWRWYCPALSLASICGFVEHALVIACALCVLLGEDYRPTLGGVAFTLFASLACGAFFRMVNPLLGTNFFFVTNPAAVGGPFAWAVNTFGNPLFLLVYLLVACVAWIILWVPWHIASGK